MVAGHEFDMAGSRKCPVATDSSQTRVFAVRQRAAAWCVGNYATFTLLCLQIYVYEDSVLDTLLSCVSVTVA